MARCRRDGRATGDDGCRDADEGGRGDGGGREGRRVAEGDRDGDSEREAERGERGPEGARQGLGHGGHGTRSDEESTASAVTMGTTRATRNPPEPLTSAIR